MPVAASAHSDDGMPQDAMVILAALVSRVEALVVASMLEAAGILVHVGAAGHASAEVNSLALGGHRMWVPASQHLIASEILLEVLGENEWSSSYGLQRGAADSWRMGRVLLGLHAYRGHDWGCSLFNACAGTAWRSYCSSQSTGTR